MSIIKRCDQHLEELSLNQQLIDLQWRDSLEEHRKPVMAGPNKWHEITSDDFGDEYDYEILDQGERWVYFPVSNAALQWACRFLPEDCPRWGCHGFIIDQPVDSPRSKTILDKLYADSLISDWDRKNHECSLLQEQAE